MRTKLPRLPTLTEFLAATKGQGCTVRDFKNRIVVENQTTGIAVIIPPMDPSSSLTQFMTEYLCRLLGVDGFIVDNPRMPPDWSPTPEEEA